MAVVALASVKGAPGVTTTALVLGAAWPAQRDIVVAECDPGGGDIAPLFVLSEEVGMTSLATSLGWGEPEALLAHCQLLLPRLPVLVSSTSPTAVAGALAVVGPALKTLATAADTDVVCDIGRLGTRQAMDGLAAGSLLEVADLVVVIVKPNLAGLTHVRHWLPALRATRGAMGDDSVGLVTIGSGYPASEIAHHLRVRVLGALPYDPDGAAAATGQGGRLDRQHLFRAARPLAEALVSAASADAPLHWEPVHALSTESTRAGEA